MNTLLLALLAELMLWLILDKEERDDRREE